MEPFFLLRLFRCSFSADLWKTSSPLLLFPSPLLFSSSTHLEQFAQIKLQDAIAAFDPSSSSDPAPHLVEARKVLSTGGDQAAAFTAACIDEQLELQIEQDRARKLYGAAVAKSARGGGSVLDLIKGVVAVVKEDPREAGKVFAHADQLAKKFKVPERRYLAAKCRALAEAGEWTQVRIMLDTKAGKKIALTDIPGKAAVEFGAPKADTDRLVSSAANKEERYALWHAAGDWKNAARTARGMRDGERMEECRDMCAEGEREEVERIISAE